MRHAFMSVDPGETTGLAWAVLNTALPHPAETLSVGQMPLPPATIPDWHRRYLQSGENVLKWWIAFRLHAERHWMVPPEDHVLVFEDYILRPMRSSKRETLSPVYISSSFEAARRSRVRQAEMAGVKLDDEPDIQWSSPSLLSSIPQEGLKQAKLWVPGREHARSAITHLLATARRMGYVGLLSPRESVIQPFFPFNEA